MFRTILILGGIVTAIIAYDHHYGPVFPDRLYCDLNAGAPFLLPGGARLTRRTMTDSGAWRDHYRAEPDVLLCKHGTLWEAWGK